MSSLIPDASSDTNSNNDTGQMQIQDQSNESVDENSEGSIDQDQEQTDYTDANYDQQATLSPTPSDPGYEGQVQGDYTGGDTPADDPNSTYWSPDTYTDGADSNPNLDYVAPGFGPATTVTASASNSIFDQTDDLADQQLQLDTAQQGLADAQAGEDAAVQQSAQDATDFGDVVDQDAEAQAGYTMNFGSIAADGTAPYGTVESDTESMV